MSIGNFSDSISVFEYYNFFDDPDSIREWALKQDYNVEGSYPGTRTEYIEILDKNLYDYMHNKICDILNLNPLVYNSNIKLQYCTEKDGKSWLHRDTDKEDNRIKYACVLYLTPNPKKNSGTLIYEVDDTDIAFSYFDKKFKDNMNEDHVLYSKVSSLFRIQNDYNKIIIYDTSALHKSDTYFGSSLDDARLFFVCFVSTEKNL